jgi:predicted  nucleic acid-binding Zn-ribbon protein
LKENLQHLISLQRVDAGLARANLRKHELPSRITRLDESFHLFSEGVNEIKLRLDELVKAHKAKEESLKKGIDNLKKTKERLLEVKTNKEYQAMLKEIDGIVKKNGETEDEIILKLEEVDAAKNSLKDKEAELSKFRINYEKEKKDLKDELGRIDEETARLARDMEGIRGKIDPEILKRYDKIKGRRNGNAVAPVWKGICEGCHMNIPPQMYNELQKSADIMQCPFCSRIIYWDDRGKNG